MFCKLIVTNKVLEPRFAAEAAASQPACPAPTTITSYVLNILILDFGLDIQYLILISFVPRGTFTKIQPRLSTSPDYLTLLMIFIGVR
jgi:hypothetical protein